jgi:hypothetical protein
MSDPRLAGKDDFSIYRTRFYSDCIGVFQGGGPIEFQDLQMPLHVVAGNLDSMTARIWSSKTTPAHSVAHAVRASCTIPLFFQPVEEGRTLLVDGGIVSNLPLFLFNESNLPKRGRGQRILLFMLEPSEERQRAEDLLELLSQIVSLAIDGGTDVQLSFAPDVARIMIPTGRVRATDFKIIDREKVDQLIQNGRKAADSFIRTELFSTRAASVDSSIFDEHEAYLRVAEQVYSAKSEVVVALTDTKWFWELFPTVFKWRSTDIRIVCLLPPPNASSSELPKEMQRRRLRLGVILIEVPTLPFRGFLIDKAENSTSTCVIYLIERSDYEPIARFYSGRIDRVALSAIHELVPEAARTAPVKGRANRIELMEPKVLLEKLRENVQFYRDPTVSLQVEEIDVSKVCLISRYVRAFRYQQIGSLIEAYHQANLKLFEPAQIPLLGGDFSIVTPPVVEQSDREFVAIEGNTRFLHCLNNGIQKVYGVVVRGVRAELPGRPTPLKQVRITSRKHPPEERIVGFNHRLFREIERAVRPLE